ncbi:MAG: hypothetical protein JW750_09280 [Anaerolineaceae bacterium]|nr:hypothetical protein [Anaerolineaceae bacterium]
MNFSNFKFNQAQFTKRFNSATVFTLITLAALVFFEIFNFSTTSFALRDLLGELSFLGIHWATTLAIAFCAVDFAGIARMFTPEEGNAEPKEIWYLFGAWLLAATMNAALTWWGVSMAIANHPVASTAIVDPKTIMKVVPVFVSIMVWVIRVLVIGSVSTMGSRLLWGQQSARSGQRAAASRRPASASVNSAASSRPMAAAPKPVSTRSYPRAASQPRIEPSYQNFSGSMEAQESKSKSSSNSNSQIYF